MDVRLHFEGLLRAHRGDEAAFADLLDHLSKEDVYRLTWGYATALADAMGWTAEQLQSYDPDGDLPDE